MEGIGEHKTGGGRKKIKENKKEKGDVQTGKRK